MAALVNVTNCVVLNPAARFLSPFQFEISFECTAPLKEDLEWKLIYVGSAESEKYDQELESIMVGPVQVGLNKFVFEADPPNVNKVPEKDLVGVTVLLITCSYRSKEFIRIGYYVNVEYDTQELRDNPPERHDVNRLVRSVLAEKPKVTRFSIEWDQPAMATVLASVPAAAGSSSSVPSPFGSAATGLFAPPADFGSGGGDGMDLPAVQSSGLSMTDQQMSL